MFSQGKNHALYLWIELEPGANAKEVAKTVKTLPKMVDMVTDPSMRDEEDEIWAGVGFSPNFYKQVNQLSTVSNFLQKKQFTTGTTLVFIDFIVVNTG